jgi:lysozyme family protein
MTENFPRALQFVLKWEGSTYSNDPADPGGETRWGISRRAYPDLDIANLTEPQAVAIYQRDYWTPAGCDDLPWPLDMIVMDTAVNMGTGRAKVLLQENTDWRDYLLSRIGVYAKIVKPKTLKFLNGWINRVIDLRRVIG